MATLTNITTIAGAPLDWLIARIQKLTPVSASAGPLASDEVLLSNYSPTTQLALGESVIAEFGVDVQQVAEHEFRATRGAESATGPTRMTAAMRCIVLSVRGLHVQVPEWVMAMKRSKDMAEGTAPAKEHAGIDMPGTRIPRSAMGTPDQRRAIQGMRA
jgi:hypothetical protein